MAWNGCIHPLVAPFSMALHLSAAQGREMDLQEALAWFDRLDPVDLAFMRGVWKGSELHTGHPLEGFLEASGWYGKEFVDPDHVHPLLFHIGDGAPVRVRPISLGDGVDGVAAVSSPSGLETLAFDRVAVAADGQQPGQTADDEPSRQGERHDGLRPSADLRQLPQN